MPPEVNNAVYSTLGERWYEASDDPVALLRAEARLHNPWILSRLRARAGAGGCDVLDLGCGAGFVANELARAGHRVTGADLSEDALEVARRHDSTGGVRYERADACRLPYGAASFDAVCAMDFLEHVEEPAKVVAEVARVLRPGGWFFFHTFNRNLLSRLVVIHGVEWMVRNVPPNLHVYRLFIPPRELEAHCASCSLSFIELRGSRPVFLSRAFWKMAASGVVPEGFRFRFTRSLAISYCGIAERSPGARLAASHSA